MVSCTRRLVGGACLAGVLYALVRPRLVRWGARDEEVARTFPGQELIPDGTRSATMAITIGAPPTEVWPWLVQLGQKEGELRLAREVIVRLTRELRKHGQHVQGMFDPAATPPPHA